ncbi:MAG: hypothetical protein ABSE57_21445 [Bryobacteraceae bacterium]
MELVEVEDCLGMRAVKRQPKIEIRNLMLKKLLLFGIGASSLLIADDALIVQVQVSHTERMDFPSGGVLRMKNSTGDLTVEGWDRPDVEITTVKSTKSYHPKDRSSAEKSLDRIRLVPERKGDELAITTEFPKHAMLARLFLGVSEFELQYRIKVPRNARLIIEHDSGNVYIDDVVGDVHATNGIGQITLHLPPRTATTRLTPRAILALWTPIFQGRSREKSSTWAMPTSALSRPRAPRNCTPALVTGTSPS